MPRTRFSIARFLTPPGASRLAASCVADKQETSDRENRFFDQARSRATDPQNASRTGSTWRVERAPELRAGSPPAARHLPDLLVVPLELVSVLEPLQTAQSQPNHRPIIDQSSPNHHPDHSFLDHGKPNPAEPSRSHPRLLDHLAGGFRRRPEVHRG